MGVAGPTCRWIFGLKGPAKEWTKGGDTGGDDDHILLDTVEGRIPLVRGWIGLAQRERGNIMRYLQTPVN